MKLILLVLTSGLLVAAGQDDTNSIHLEPVVGRYQLIVGTVGNQPTVFRIDTVTGTTWYFCQTPWLLPGSRGKASIPVDYWQRISERDFLTQAYGITTNPVYKAIEESAKQTK